MLTESISGADTFDLAEWRISLDMTIASLQKRISHLEENYTRVSRSEAPVEPSSWLELKLRRNSNFAQADHEGIDYRHTCIGVLRSHFFAKLQLLLLICSIIAFVYYEVDMYQRAKFNEETDFNPEAKMYAKDYSQEEETLLYEFPYVCLKLFMSIENNTNVELNESELVTQLLRSQDYFNNRLQILYDMTNKGEVPGIFTSAFLVTNMTDDGFWLMFNLEVTDLSRNGRLMMAILLDMDAITLNRTLIPTHLLVLFSREELATSADLPSAVPALLDYSLIEGDESIDLFVVEYTETVHHKYQSDEQTSDFEITSSRTTATIDYFHTQHNVLVSDTDIAIWIVPSLKVEHWQEYVAFGYENWLAEMGGLLSISVPLFFWVSYYIAVCFGDGISMGILPGLSFTFFNFEGLEWMKNKSGASKLL